MNNILFTDFDSLKVALSTSGFSSQGEITHLYKKDDIFYVQIKEDRILKNIDANPRVSIYIEENGQNLVGILYKAENSSFNIEENVALYTFTPYKSEIDGKQYVFKKMQWIEKEKEKVWTSVPLKEKIALWKRAIRSTSIAISFYPILLAGLVYFGKGDTFSLSSLALLVFTIIGGVALHLGINLISDYYDYMRGVDTTDSLSEAVSVLVDDIMTPNALLFGSIICFIIATFVGGYLTSIIGLPVILFGLIGLIGGYAYTGEYFKLKYRGHGELLSGALMGPVLYMATEYVMSSSLTLTGFFISLALGLYIAMVTLANNLRDMIYDRRAQFTTLPMHIGIEKSKQIYYALAYLPYVCICLAVLLDYRLMPILLVFLSIPMANKAKKEMDLTESTEMAFYTTSREYIHILNAIMLLVHFSRYLGLGVILYIIFF